jgi:hypothetical protein
LLTTESNTFAWVISIGSYERRSELLSFRCENPQNVAECHGMRISFFSATIVYHMKRGVPSSFLRRKRWEAEGSYIENKNDHGEPTGNDDTPCGFLDEITGYNGIPRSPTTGYHRKIWK